MAIKCQEELELKKKQEEEAKKKKLQQEEKALALKRELERAAREKEGRELEEGAWSFLLQFVVLRYLQILQKPKHTS